MNSFTKKVHYYKPTGLMSLHQFSNKLSYYIQTNHRETQPIIVLCIGTDRATGDSLGPLIGYKLKDYTLNDIYIYGTLAFPVHAKNLAAIIEQITEEHINPFIIAIDASLGQQSNIGLVTLAKGPLSPGSGVNKELSPIGDIHITGIVNFSGYMEMVVLQNTRLNVVMELADFIAKGIFMAIKTFEERESVVLSS